MTITDPSKRPSDRFIEVIGTYFFSKGYTYKKSTNKFVRVIENREEIVTILIYKQNLVSVSLQWAIRFPELENIYQIINHDESERRVTNTLWTDLLNYYPLRQKNTPSDFWLFNRVSSKYDDISINDASDKFIRSYEGYVEPFFEHYKCLTTLEQELNSFPLRHHLYIGYAGRHIALGLVLGKIFHKEKFEQLKHAYQEYILADKEGEEFREQMQMFFDATIKYVESDDLEKVHL